MIRLFGIANCDTIRKTRKWLRSHRLEFEFRDYKKRAALPIWYDNSSNILAGRI